MEKTRIYNLVILDASGSMCSIKRQAIDGFNETVQTIKAAQAKFESQEHLISLVVFNSDSTTTLYDRVAADKVQELNAETYQPNCGTPLYDAIGMATNKLLGAVKSGDKVLVTIITDGYENASKEYSGRAIKSLINDLKGKGWLFTYIGANQNVEQVAGSMGILNRMVFQSTPQGTRAMFATESRSRTGWFEKIARGESDESLQENYFEEEK